MQKRLAMLMLGLLLTVAAALAQTKVTGTVVGQDDGEPVIGASVMVQGTKTGTTTNLDGKFTLNVPKGKKLVISYVGMVTQTVTAKDGMRVVMKSDA